MTHSVQPLFVIRAASGILFASVLWTLAMPLNGWGQTPGGDVDQAALSSLGGRSTAAIVEIDFTDSQQINDETIKSLSPLRRDLRRLTLANTPITDEGVYWLREFSELTHLDLSGTQVTNASLEYVGELTSLRYLSLSKSKITGGGAIDLIGLRQLETLDLSETHVDDDTVRDLRALPRLRTLSLRGCLAIDNCVRSFPDFPELRSLDLSGIKLQSMAGFNGAEWSKTRLESLKLNNTQVSKSLFSEIYDFRYLRELGVANTQITGEELLGFVQFRHQFPAFAALEKLYVGQHLPTRQPQLHSDEVRTKILETYPKVEIITVEP